MTVAKLAAKLPLLYRRLLGDGDLAPIQADMEEMYRDWVQDLDAAVKRCSSFYDERFASQEDRLATLEQDAEFWRIGRNFRWEAAREAMDERRAMLANAFAGLADPRLTVEEKARVERVLRQLDPIDARSLWGLVRAAGRHDIHGRRYESESELLHELWRSLANADALVAAGCVRVGIKGGVGAGDSVREAAVVTKIGLDVIRVLEPHLVQVGAPFLVPGRHPEPDAEAEARAQQTIDRSGRLREFIRWVNGNMGVHRQYDMPPRQPPFRTENTPKILLSGIDRALLPESRDLLTHLVGAEDAPVVATVTEHPTEPVFDVVLKGDHAVLRVVADAVGARWTA
ncbi:MAG TPA: hypothetical protein VHE30_11100 [Polyangiaceae bacterium]|nr:hypothetical protein [Polyangiaceae bacterium]